MTFVQHYLQAVQEKQNIVLECISGKKKWLFYFVEGQLAQSKSNIKTEQTEELQAAHPDMDAQQILVLQSQMRIEKSLKAEEVHLRTSSATPSDYVPTLDVLVTGMSTGYTPEEIEEMCADLKKKKPKLVESFDTTDKETHNFLSTLKGNLRAPVTISNFGIATTKGWSIIWICDQLGLFAPYVEEETLEKLLDFDLEALLLEEIAKPDEIVDDEEEILPPSNTTPTENDEEVLVATTNTTVSTQTMSLAEIADHIENAQNYFEILGVTHTDPVDMVRSSFFELSKKVHPDRYAGESEEIIQRATHVFDLVRQAHDTLSDETERKKYIDKVIHGKVTDDEAAMEQLQAIFKAEEAFKKGERFFQQGQISKAHEFFEEAYRNDPNSLEYKAHYGYTIFTQNQNSHPTTAEEGLEMIQDAIRTNESQEVKLDSLWVLLGRAYREKGDTTRAKTAITKALKIKPSNADAAREMKRLTSQNPGGPKKPEAEQNNGFFSKFFGGKK